MGTSWLGEYEKCIIVGDTKTTYDVKITSDGVVCQNVLKMYVRPLVHPSLGTTNGGSKKKKKKSSSSSSKETSKKKKKKKKKKSSSSSKTTNKKQGEKKETPRSCRARNRDGIPLSRDLEKMVQDGSLERSIAESMMPAENEEEEEEDDSMQEEEEDGSVQEEEETSKDEEISMFLEDADFKTSEKVEVFWKTPNQNWWLATITDSRMKNKRLQYHVEFDQETSYAWVYSDRVRRLSQFREKV
jgi:hypothetical protein